MTAQRAELVRKLHRTTAWANAAAVAIAVAALVGWFADVDLLNAYIDGWPPVGPLTVICLLGITAALALLQRGGSRARTGAFLLLAATAGGVVAVLFLPVADELPGGTIQVYMGSTMLLLAVAIALAYQGRSEMLVAGQILAGSAAALVYIAVMGISFRLLSEAEPLMQVSLPSVAVLTLLVYSTFAGKPGPWLLDRLTSARPGAVITRQLVPAILALPLLIGWVRLLGQRAELFDPAFGSLLLTVLTVIALGMLVLWGADTLDRVDARRTEAERHASTQREWLRVTLASCNDAVVATDANGLVRFVNPAAQALIGSASGALIGHAMDEVVCLQDESGNPITHPVRTVLRRDKRSAGYSELRLMRADGTCRFVEVSAAPIHEEGHMLLGAVMVMRDVSERRRNDQALRTAYAELDRRVAERTAALERANAALHESLALFRGVAESTPDLIYVKDRGGRLVMANPATIRVIGRPESEILGRTDRDFLANDAQAARVMENDRRVLCGGRVERIEESLTSPEGERTYLATKSPLRDINGETVGLICVATDITERKRMENELREAQRFTQGLLDTAPIILYLFDPVQRRVVYASGRGLSGLGYEPSELLEMTPVQLARMVHSEDLPTVQAHLRQYEAPRDGLREIEFRYRHRDQEWRWLHARERLFEPGTGGTLVLGVAVDITESKRAQLERERLIAAEQRLRLDAERANRAKDEFLAIVSHELRSPLNALRGWGFLLGNARPLEPSLVERATTAIKRNVDHQARLIDDLLDTSRIMSGKLNIERRPVDIMDVVNGALEVVRPAAAAKRIRLEVTAARTGLVVEGDAARLHQVFVNLLSNAAKFTPEAGEVKVAAGAHEGYAMVAVTDTGAGIPQEFLPRVFERFTQADTSTTRRHGGLGIGLALVRHLTELHGGRVTAHSAGADKGSTFTVELPMARESAPRAPVAASAGDVPAAGGLAGTRIYALDDDPDAREVISLTLNQAGAEVTALATGAELISLLEDELPRQRPDVLLLDLAMPIEDGFAVLAKVRALEDKKRMSDAQRMPAIAVTAFTEINAGRVMEFGFTDYVSKPIDAARLVSSIRRALRAHAQATSPGPSEQSRVEGQNHNVTDAARGM
jgi:PAS domain S-box-containing protein